MESLMALMIQVVTGPLEGCSFLLPEGSTLTIGRSSQNDITLPYDPWISSAHASLKDHKGAANLMDLSSSNGSFINGDKVEPNTYLPIREYFILGSTLCRVSKPETLLDKKPLSVHKSAADALLDIPLVRAAYKIARHRQSPKLGVLHLFMAILDREKPEVDRFLKSLKLEATHLRQSMDKLQIFDGANQWINEFLTYQYRSRKQKDCYISPLVQSMLEQIGDRDIDSVEFLKLILHQPYTILFPLLGITDRQVSGTRGPNTEKITLNPYDSEFDELILPSQFWQDLGNALDRHSLVLLTGGNGTGKTAILKQCFHSLPKVNITQFKSGGKRIFDPEVFLVFNETAALLPYVNLMIKALRSPGIIAIDHFGTLIHLMQKHNIAENPLFRAINKRKEPVVLAISDAFLGPISASLNKPSTLRMEDYLPKVSQDILETFISEFESETKCRISAKARQFLTGPFLSQYNFTSIKAFLGFCGDSLRNLSFLYGELKMGSDSDTKELSKAFFKSMLDDWTSPFSASAGPNHSENLDLSIPDALEFESDKLTTPKNPASQEFAEAFEKVIKGFTRKNLRCDIAYSDGSRKIADESALGQEQKALELQEQTKLLLYSFKSGFLHWLNAFLAELDPREIEAGVGDNPKMEALWEEFVSRFELLDKRFIMGHYLDISRKVFKRKVKDLAAQAN